jgi:hypothetical protein
VLQLCFYSETIAAIQGMPPEAMHVLLGVGERSTLRHADYAAYYRRVRRGFEAALGRRGATEPYRIEHCALCEFREVCEEWWMREDHLVLVAGMRREQVQRLRAAGISTLAGLAEADPAARIQHLAAHTFDALREQAALQAQRRSSGRLEWRALPVEPERGFQRLPRPSPGDIVFDIEGDPFWEPARGLHFLFGLLIADGDQWRYRQLWAHDRVSERQTFETLIDFFHERLAAPRARRPWTTCCGVRVFVDLHGVVRQRPDGAAWAEVHEPRPVTEDRRAADAEREALRQALLAGGDEGSPRWLAGELLEYHRREARPAWWWFFERCGMSLDDLVDDAESIGRLEPDGRPVTRRSTRQPARRPGRSRPSTTSPRRSSSDAVQAWRPCRSPPRSFRRDPTTRPSNALRSRASRRPYSPATIDIRRSPTCSLGRARGSRGARAARSSRRRISRS